MPQKDNQKDNNPAGNTQTIASFILKPFILKYSPKKTSDLVGQEQQITQIKDFVSNYKKSKSKSKKRGLILYGPPGCGKTSSAYCIAKESSLEIVEINASDFRNKEQIETVLGNAIKQQSLFFKGKIILVDEIDGLSGTKDRGGVPALAGLISGSTFPVICTATNPFAKNISSLRKLCNLIQFNEPSYSSIAVLLKKICGNEKISYDLSAINSLARMAGGDIRAALNDLHSIAIDKKCIDKAALESLGMREKSETVPSALVKIFKTKDTNIAVEAFANVDEEPQQLLLWLDENLPLEYTNPADLARAYDYLSKADIMLGRIRRWQHWRFLVYTTAFMTAGVAVSKDKKNTQFISYKPTSRILQIWIANNRYAKRKSIAEKIASATHSSAKRIVNDVIPYLSPIFKSNTKQAKAVSSSLAEEFGLDEDEVAWLSR